MVKLISEIFDEVESTKKKEDKVNILRKNDSPALRLVLQYAFDPRVVFYSNQFPPYKPDYAPEGLSFSSLHNEAKLLYRFTNQANITEKRKHELLLQVLESMHQKDSALLYSILTRTVLKNHKSLTPKVINEAFPGLIHEKA